MISLYIESDMPLHQHAHDVEMVQIHANIIISLALVQVKDSAFNLWIRLYITPEYFVLSISSNSSMYAMEGYDYFPTLISFLRALEEKGNVAQADPATHNQAII
mmetsp:Transcript_1182/g.2946  ORF Transcript_1182/g.2946 Transcript_1182/m.2946 type:complete len:104 (-) Transcript_1182:1790-2101(-)